MIRAFRAELGRLVRRRVLLGTALTVLVFAVGGAAIVLRAAPDGPRARDGFAPTVAALADAGGGTEVFRFAVAFAGTFTFVLFIAVFAVEFSRGTYRTMLLRRPGRTGLLAGRLGAMLAFAAVALACTEAVTWLAARALAPSFGVATGAWTSLDALGAALADLGAVLVWVTGYAVLGMTVAVLLRSVPLALAVGIAWAGPVEHLLQDAWGPAQRFFPGLLLEVVGQGGTPDVSFTRALATALVYTAVAAAVAAAVFARRDVTG